MVKDLGKQLGFWILRLYIYCVQRIIHFGMPGGKADRNYRIKKVDEKKKKWMEMLFGQEFAFCDS